MISYLTILLFFLYLWGLGYTAASRLRLPENRWERHSVYVAIGLGLFPIIAILLNLLHLPLDWKVFLLLSMGYPAVQLGRKLVAGFAKENVVKRKFAQLRSGMNMASLLKVSKSSLFLVVAVALVLLSLFMYAKGAFSYPYLEDEDPWGHSIGAKYVALEKNAYDPVISGRPMDWVLSYIDPYPPAYDILMGILHQTSPDLNWTLKFFNALIISLGLLFFYLFAKEFTGEGATALLATYFLAAIPAYFSHFIWAHSLVITIFFPTMYVFLKIAGDARWAWLGGGMIGSIWVTQNIEQPLKLSMLLLIFVVVSSLVQRRVLRYQLAALAGGVVLSLTWWGVMVHKYSLRGFIRYYTGDRIVGALEGVDTGAVVNSAPPTLLDKAATLLHSVTSAGGSGSRAYSWQDFLLAKGQNAINTPIGIGVVISLLALGTVVYLVWHSRRELLPGSGEHKGWLMVALFWLIYTFWGVNGQTFPVSIARGPFRIWMLLAIPTALLAAAGTLRLKGYLSTKSKMLGLLLVLLVLGASAFTSAYPKYQLNTAPWPTSGSFVHPAEPFEYGAWFQTIPLNTNVFLYAPRDKLVIGYGGFSCVWCPEVPEFRDHILDYDTRELHRFLRAQGYEYLILNQGMDYKYLRKVFGEEKTKELLPQRYEEIQRSGLFTPVYQRENRWMVLKVVE